MNKQELNRDKKEIIAVVGLGYVGLPLAIEFSKHYEVIGFDVNEEKIKSIKMSEYTSDEVSMEELMASTIDFTSNEKDLQRATVYIVAVPTDINAQMEPDLSHLRSASTIVGRNIKKGGCVVYESTVYPGCTEEVCVPIIEQESGLKAIEDFSYGYSPERIVPGKGNKKLTQINKIVSGCDEKTIQKLYKLYDKIIDADLHVASSVKVAEAAKVVENTQRDLNISLMNELAILFDKLNIKTHDVIEAAGTKWNFQKLYPGLVGGHCISIDPYYLLHKSYSVGYSPEVIKSGRRVNNKMPQFIADKQVQLLSAVGKTPENKKVLVIGITFKEDVSDIRNSKVVDLIKALEGHAMKVEVLDSEADKGWVKKKTGIQLIDAPGSDYDAIIFAVPHQKYRERQFSYYLAMFRDDPVFIDLKGIFRKEKLADKITYWCP